MYCHTCFYGVLKIKHGVSRSWSITVPTELLPQPRTFVLKLGDLVQFQDKNLSSRGFGGADSRKLK